MSWLFLLAASVSAAPVVDFLGECPGPVEIDITGVTRGAPVVILFGEGPGSTPIPGGPCVGADSRLDGRLSKVGPVRDPDADGRFLLLPALPERLCDRTMSIVDLSSCEASEPIRLGPPDGFVFSSLQVIDGADVTCGSVENTAEYTQCNDLRKDDLYFPNGISCGPVWSSESSSYSDTAGFCEALTGSPSIEVYYECDVTQDRATWFDGVWSTTRDNGFTRHVRCYYP